MTKLLSLGALALAAAIAMPATSRAQQTTTPHHHHFGHALFHGVNMTKDERAQVRTIHHKYATEIRAARQAGDQTSIRAMRAEQLDEMRAVLTPAQQATFDANRAALRARAKSHAKPSAAPAAPAAPAVPAVPAAPTS